MANCTRCDKPSEGDLVVTSKGKDGKTETTTSPRCWDHRYDNGPVREIQLKKLASSKTT